MSRRSVIRALRRHDCIRLRTVGGHDVWQCPCGAHIAPVPRHTTITAGTARSIANQMACLPKGWLQ